MPLIQLPGCRQLLLKPLKHGLAFASVCTYIRQSDRRVLENVPGHNIKIRLSHHQDLLCQCQACLQGEMEALHYCSGQNRKTLLPPDSFDVDAAYQDFCNIIRKAAKKAISCGYRNNYISCWDVECESLYRTIMWSPQSQQSSLAATVLFTKLDSKRKK